MSANGTMTEQDIQARKETLRREALARRDAIAPEQRAALSAQIVLQIAAVIAERRPRYVAAYASIRSEVDTLALLDLMIEQSSVACLPAVIGERMVFRSWTPGSPLKPGPLGAPEPPAEAAEVMPDLVVAPVAAFDRQGGRLGYGHGFYDKAVAALRAEGRAVWLVGAAFGVQQVDTIPLEPHDIPLDLIATESETIVLRAG